MVSIFSRPHITTGEAWHGYSLPNAAPAPIWLVQREDHSRSLSPPPHLVVMKHLLDRNLEIPLGYQSLPLPLEEALTPSYTKPKTGIERGC